MLAHAITNSRTNSNLSGREDVWRESFRRNHKRKKNVAATHIFKKGGMKRERDFERVEAIDMRGRVVLVRN